ncbi:protein DMR6-LIKE OXYGENASE 1-like [Senna tora]|uniref:Protein DMR6-LIKE OXYGENASE 1-like n=1 Tax=Senna tora TaxID=362788 RepID=A0A834T6Y2_9FABA|nr:protein DMR6-LIKE OXYGENASE 1-like [Senna tora]
MLSVKGLVESHCLSSIPSKFVCPKTPEDSMLCESDINNIIPTIDFSHLISSNPNQTSKAIQQLGLACRDWGFFMLINHGVAETLRNEVVKGSQRFFDLTEEEKKEYAGRDLLDPIRCGTSFNPSVEKNLFWRDYLKLQVHPHFHAPTNPPGFSEIIEKYCEKSRGVVEVLLKGISRSLGLEENYIDEKMNLESGSQVFVVNYYPPCPKPELAMGLPAHTDHGLLTLLMQNQIGGLQVQHNGEWVPVNPPPNSYLVNTGDQMEVLSNGRYKSVVHRAVVNKKAVRISIGTAHGPSLDTCIHPASDLITHDYPPAYRAITYKDYMFLKQSNPLDTKSCLDLIRI